MKDPASIITALQRYVGRYVCVFNPVAPFNCLSFLSSTSKKHENINGVITIKEYMRLSMLLLHLLPCVMSATGGLAHEATVYYKHLASLLSAI